MSSLISDGATFVMSEYPDSLISALQKDRNSMVDSFVDESVRFYSLLLVYPWIGVSDALRLCKGGFTVKVKAEGPNYRVAFIQEVVE